MTQEEWAKERAWLEERHSSWLHNVTTSMEESAWSLAMVSIHSRAFMHKRIGALAQARSRCVGFTTRSGERMLVLPPAIDMANHGREANCLVQLDLSCGKVFLQPKSDIAAGQVPAFLLAV